RYQGVAEIERPARAEGSGVRVIHIEITLEREPRRRSAERKVGDPDEQRQIGGVDENLRITRGAAGIAAANRIVCGKTVLERTPESRLGAIPASALGRG